jgi:hypothetical protein
MVDVATHVTECDIISAPMLDCCHSEGRLCPRNLSVVLEWAKNKERFLGQRRPSE